ncbi:MAG: hypothetical protein M1833_002636 [Piccolia ochrophora]|nr:MAG: hypothetical protein M1833_002636 [Piccolia ochrophora]
MLQSTLVGSLAVLSSVVTALPTWDSQAAQDAQACGQPPAVNAKSAAMMSEPPMLPEEQSEMNDGGEAQAQAQPYGGEQPAVMPQEPATPEGAMQAEAMGEGQAEAAAGAKAVYYITNSAQGNAVVALKINYDGTLSDGSTTMTGGNGAQIIDGKTGQPAATDALASQGALAVAGQMMVVVNAGSNTLTMFAIDAADPTVLSMVGEPVDTMGEFPVSVGASAALSTACVGNTGAVAGVACFTMSADTGLTATDGALRPFDLGQSTPPVGPENNVAHVLFNDDSSALLATVKGDPSKNNTGFLAAFPVAADGAVATHAVRSSPAGTAVLFGAANVPGTRHVVATDASFGVATLALTPDGTASLLNNASIPGQKATCWATLSRTTNTAFVTDVAVNSLHEFDPLTGELVAAIPDVGNGNPGMLDLATAGGFVYALAPGNSSAPGAVAVFDVGRGRGKAVAVQNFVPRVGVPNTAMSMQVSQ